MQGQRFTKQQRQEIVDAFLEKHGGEFVLADFIKEAKRKTHPAHSWFEWDDSVAAAQYRIQQARHFVSDLRISFEIKRTERGKVNVKTVTVPAVVSDGGGTYRPTTEQTMDELCSEALTSLDSWIRRYSGATTYAGVELKDSVLCVRMALEAKADNTGD